MDKRIMTISSNGLQFTRGRPVELPDKYGEFATHAKRELKISDIRFRTNDDDERPGYYQIICLAGIKTALHDANKAFVFDIPERTVDMIVYDTSESEALSWIEQQNREDNELEEERKETEEEEEERTETSEEMPAATPEETNAAIALLQQQQASLALPEGIVLAPVPMTQPIHGLEICEPLPLMTTSEAKER